MVSLGSGAQVGAACASVVAGAVLWKLARGKPASAKPALQTSGKVTAKKWVIKKWPEGPFDPEKDVELVTEEMDLDAEVPEGKVILQVELLSCDAFVRTMMKPGAFHGSAQLGTVLPSIGYGRVLKSCEGGPAVGTRMMGMMGATSHATCSKNELMPDFFSKFGVRPSSMLNMLGLTTGLTAYAGVHCCTKPPRRGDTVIVSAAGGGVGVYAAQLCKATGAKVIGVAGGPTKCEFLTKELGLDGAIDYKDKSSSIAEQLDKLCPEGIDFFFDNVGGEILVEVLNRLKINCGARVVLCGGITKYNDKDELHATGGGPSSYLKLAERGAMMTGFVVTTYMKNMIVGVPYMLYLQWRGYLKSYETRKTGIEEYARTMNTLFTGGSVGKTLVDLMPGHED